MDPTFTLGFTGYPVETRDSFITVGQCYVSVKSADLDPTFTLGLTGYPVETWDSFITVGQCYLSVKTADLEPIRWQKERNADIRSKPISLPIYHPGCHHLYNIRPGKCYFGSKENRQWRAGGTALFVASELQAAKGYSAVFSIIILFSFQPALYYS